MARWPDFEVSPGGIVKDENFNSGHFLMPDKDAYLSRIEVSLLRWGVARYGYKGT